MVWGRLIKFVHHRWPCSCRDTLQQPHFSLCYQAYSSIRMDRSNRISNFERCSLNLSQPQIPLRSFASVRCPQRQKQFLFSRLKIGERSSRRGMYFFLVPPARSSQSSLPLFTHFRFCCSINTLRSRCPENSRRRKSTDAPKILHQIQEPNETTKKSATRSPCCVAGKNPSDYSPRLRPNTNRSSFGLD